MVAVSANNGLSRARKGRKRYFDMEEKSVGFEMNGDLSLRIGPENQRGGGRAAIRGQNAPDEFELAQGDRRVRERAGAVGDEEHQRIAGALALLDSLAGTGHQGDDRSLAVEIVVRAGAVFEF